MAQSSIDDTHDFIVAGLELIHLECSRADATGNPTLILQALRQTIRNTELFMKLAKGEITPAQMAHAKPPFCSSVLTEGG